jgi:ATP-dependent RNA helicase MSS116, mitochondrial
MCALVLDEADQLLEMGFRPAIEAALRRLPPPAARQTLLFSATMPADVRAISRIALRPEYTTIDTVSRA